MPMALGLLIAIMALWWEYTHEAPDSGPHSGAPLILFCFMALAAIGTAVAAIALRSEQLSASALQKVVAHLDCEASKIAALAASSIDSHASYAESLSAMHDRISAVKTPDQLRAIATLLAAENHRMRLETQGMARKLEVSRTQLKALHVSLEEAQKQGLRDSLTKVGNRRAFDNELEDAVKMAKANADPLSVVMVDIDHFKSINDKYGHQAGDAVLQSFAELLSRFVRNGDRVARFGGEEFAIVLPATASLAASILAERLRFQIEEESFEIPLAGCLRITASLGVAQLCDGETASDLVNRADKLLYRAKSLGRNRVAAV